MTALTSHAKSEVVRAFVEMYRSRAALAIRHNRDCEDDPRCVACRIAGPSPAVVPDMDVQLWSRGDVAAQCDASQVGTRIALSEMGSCPRGACMMGIAFDDGDFVALQVVLQRVGR